MDELQRLGTERIVTVEPDILFDQLLPRQVDFLRDRKFGPGQFVVLIPLRRPESAVENLLFRRAALTLPHKTG